jgi:hypothetical protein
MVLLAQTARLGVAYALAQVLTGLQLGTLMAAAVLGFGVTLEATFAILPVGLLLVALQAPAINAVLRRIAHRRITTPTASP